MITDQDLIDRQLAVIHRLQGELDAKNAEIVRLKRIVDIAKPLAEPMSMLEFESLIGHLRNELKLMLTEQGG